jgi:predicted nucleic acid-binding protein
MVLITEYISNFKLSFDDAYQLTLSQIYDLNILTYDNDFKIEGVNSINPLDLDILRY